MTAACEAIYRQHPQFRFKLLSMCPEIFASAPWHFAGREDQVITVDYGPWIQRSNQSDVRYLSSFFEDLRNKLGIDAIMTTGRPHIYLTDGEQERPVAEPYAVICSGYKDDYPVKGYRAWQPVVDWIRQELGIKVIQVGEAHHNHKLLNGVEDWIGKTSIRQLFSLAYHASFGMGHESFLHHIFAAHFHARPDRAGLPFVVVASGWNPKAWIAYSSEVYITRQGQLPCCAAGGCWKKGPCEFYDEATGPKCMNMIGSDEIIRAVKDMCDSGRITVASSR